MPRRSRAEIRWASLRAAAKVALFAGTMACGAPEATSLSQQALDAGQFPDATTDVTHPDASELFADASSEADAATGMDAASAMDAGAADMGPADMGIADAAMADTGIQCGTFPQTQEEIAAWQECCNENFGDPGCQVWGPPAPPSMEIA